MIEGKETSVEKHQTDVHQTQVLKVIQDLGQQESDAERENQMNTDQATTSTEKPELEKTFPSLLAG